MNTFQLSVLEKVQVLPKNPQRPNIASPDSRDCFYCHEMGHVKAHCPALQLKEHNQSSRKPKSLGLVQSTPTLSPVSLGEPEKNEVDECYKLLCFLPVL